MAAYRWLIGLILSTRPASASGARLRASEGRCLGTIRVIGSSDIELNKAFLGQLENFAFDRLLTEGALQFLDLVLRSSIVGYG